MKGARWKTCVRRDPRRGAQTLSMPVTAMISQIIPFMDVPAWRSQWDGLFVSPSSGDGLPEAPGGTARHIPVLGRPAVDYLNVRAGGLIIDGTFGAGGYTRDILARANCRVIGIDRDPDA